MDQEIIELERRYWQAMKDRDGEVAKQLSAESCLVTGAQGTRSFSADQLSLRRSTS